jgi:hypothetical protein
MGNTKILGHRAWEKGPSQAERITAAIKRQNIRNFGRPDVASVVKAAVENYATDHKTSLKTALNVLIAEIGSYKELLRKLTTEAARTRRKHKRQRAVASTENELPRGAIYKQIRIVVGRAPGLGGVRKPIRVKTRS